MTLFRKIIRIRAEDSPNVRRALEQQARGERPDGINVVPGVLSWAEYQDRRAHWEPERQTVGLDADWWEGPDVKLFPPAWRANSNKLAEELRRSGVRRLAKAIGVDPAEGGDQTCIAVVDELGLIELLSLKTPNTTDVTARVLAVMKRHQVDPHRVMFDSGGGGKEHADRLRLQGFPVRLVGFGSAPSVEIKRMKTLYPEKREVREDRYVYKNRRAEMYHELSLLMDPARPEGTFAIPARPAPYDELDRQLAIMPKVFDEEGRIVMPPKNRRDDRWSAAEDNRPTLSEQLGRSPDEADALVVAVHSMLHRPMRAVAGVV